MAVINPGKIMVKIGVLALQGAFREHLRTLKKCGADAIEIRFPHQLEEIDGLIIPGGESTTITKLMDKYHFRPALEKFHKEGKPLFGTCAGMILLSRQVSGHDFALGFIDISVVRNAYGRQVDSFEKDIELANEGNLNHGNFKAVFIRAPKILKTGPDVNILGTLDGSVILARQDNVLAASFHPELTDDTRIHMYFIDMVIKSKNMIKSKSSKEIILN